MKIFTCRVMLLALAVLLSAHSARATLFKYVTAEPSSPTGAVINADGSLTESGVNYAVVYKPVPQAAWVESPWIDTSHAYNGQASIGFEINPTPDPGSTLTDKVQLTISGAHDASAATFDTHRDLGFAVYIPSANFEPPTHGGVQLCQWFQGSPYTPPLSVTITGETSGGATFEVLVYNNATGGNPSSVPVIVATGTIPFDTWTPIVIEAVMDYNYRGRVDMWENGTLLVSWTGSVGYNPATIPYNPSAGTPPPNSLFAVDIGPYRAQQATTQEFFFDEVRHGPTPTPTRCPWQLLLSPRA